MSRRVDVKSTSSRDASPGYLIGSGRVPKARTNLLHQELEGSVEQYSTSHLDRLLKEAASTDACNSYLHNSAHNTVYNKKKWKVIPQTPKDKISLYEPLVQVASNILSHFDTNGSRRVFDIHDKNTKSEDINVYGLKARPDLVITGSGEHFYGNVEQCDRWYQCAAVIEVKKDCCEVYRGRRKKTEEEEEREAQCEKNCLAQLAYYACQTLSSQPTRTFVYNILITERRVRLYRFDRVGVQYSQWFNYRDEPRRLVQIICLAAGPDLGLDMTVVFKGNTIEFTLEKEGQPFIVTADHRPRFPSFDLIGRATVCWSVRDKDDNCYILKQQFVNTSSRLEHETLDEVQNSGVNLSAIGTCVMGQTLTKVSESRGLCDSEIDPKHNRILYRILLTEHGDPIENLKGKTILDLLVALRDAILGHKNLWDAGFIHRDISINNILYRKKSPGDTTLRGVLIDFDLTVVIKRNASNYKADFRTGTRAFQSVIVLESSLTDGEGPFLLHEHLDDLESFFWVLFWITREQVAPGTPPEKLIDKLLVRNKMEAPADDCLMSKGYFLSRHSTIPLQPGWGSEVTTLVNDLATFFDNIVAKKRIALVNKGIALSADELIKTAPAHYDTVLALFTTAIDAIKLTTPSGPSSTAQVLHPPTTNGNSPNQQHSSEPSSPITAPIPALSIPKHILRSSKRSREAEILNQPTILNDDPFPPVAHLPPKKKLRSAKSAPVLQPEATYGISPEAEMVDRPMSPAADTSPFAPEPQLPPKKKLRSTKSTSALPPDDTFRRTTRSVGRMVLAGNEAGPSRGRTAAAATQPAKKASTSRVSSKGSSGKRSSSAKTGKKV